MKSEIVFQEEQCFANKRVRNFFLILAAFLVISIIIRLIVISDMEQDWLLAILVVGFLISSILSIFLSNCLVTEITIDGIYIRFPPFMPNEQEFLWEEIAEVYIIKYNPITQYGGWGIRIGPFGRAYNISSNTGLQIIFRDNSRLLIGTRQSEKLAAVLRKLGRME